MSGHFGVQKLYLQHFRNLEKLTLSELSNFNVLCAKNGYGKTNILEALSLFTPGKGLRSAEISELMRKDSTQFFQVGMTLDDQLETHLGTTAEQTDSGRLKRLYKKDAAPLKAQSALTEYLSIVWLTPAMDRILSEDSQTQRQFIDRLTFALFPEHARHRTSYDKLLKERNTILKEGGIQTHAKWLDQIESQLSDYGLKIIDARRHILTTLEALQSDTPLFPTFTTVMQSDCEVLLNDALSKEDYCRKLYDKRSQDALRGTTSFGPHKSKLNLLHRGKQMPAEFCSTGEQKMLLLAMILAFVKNDFKRGVLLLLDDVMDHLDEKHRAVLFAEVQKTLRERKLQVWMTGASMYPFEAVRGEVHILQEDDLERAKR